jgi:surfactin synthase thioesterase subunit
MGSSPAPSLLRLFCIEGDAGAYGPAWQAGLAPEIEVIALSAAPRPQRADGVASASAIAGTLAGRIIRLLDDRPYAVLGYGAWAWAGLAVSRLLAAGHQAAHLIVACCPAPPGGEQPVSCPVTAFAVAGAGADQADGMAGWRSVTTGPFTLRLLPDQEPDNGREPGRPGEWADAATLLAIKEETRVWPS